MNKELKKRIFSSVILILISFFIIMKGSILFNFFLVVCYLLTTYEWHMMYRIRHYRIIGYIFIIFSYYSAFSLRNMFDEKSLMYFLFILIICISTDIGGYSFGLFQAVQNV